MKKILLFVLLCATLLQPRASFADGETYGWIMASEITKSSEFQWGATFTENTNVYPSHVEVEVNSGNLRSSKLCKDVNDSYCIANNGWAAMIIPPCSVDNSSMCIQGLSAGRDGSLQSTSLIRVIKSQIVEGNINDQIPNGYNQSLWSFKGSDGFADQNFAVYVLYRKVLKGKIIDFQVQVRAYKESISNDYKEQKISEWQRLDGTTGLGGSNPDRGCIWIEEGACGKPDNIQNGLRLELSLKVFDGVTGWLSGRLKQPKMSISDVGSGLKQIVISAEAVDVPKAYAFLNAADATPELKNIYSFPGMNSKESFLFTSMANDPGSMKFYDNWLKYWPKNAYATSSLWGFTTLLGNTHSCLTDKSRIVGLVTTNAMAYEGRPPQFIDGEIQYRVASVHNDTAGNQLQGIYDLVIDSKVARCLYGFSAAPISASVSITSSEGNQNIATTVVNEKDGWFRMGAYGFHYSSPTIKVKLLQEKAAEAAKPIEEPKPSALPGNRPEKISIFCIKGKISKKVTAINPKCPAGYKKK